MSSGFVLEVVKYIPDLEETKRLQSRYQHLGYMEKVFKTKKDAIKYYDDNNPHMRSLNAHGTFKSDWDPETYILYIVREHYGISCTINSFV